MLLSNLIVLSIITALEAFNVTKCGVEKGCITQPNNCDPLSVQSCERAFSYQVDGEYLIMELMGKTDNNRAAAYVAVGFSTDKIMGNDSVTECSVSANQPLRGRLSYNLQKENMRVNAPQNVLDDMLNTISAEYRNGVIFCVLRQKIVSLAGIPVEQVKPLNVNYYVFLASGPASDLGILMHSIQHDNRYPFISNQPLNLQQYRSRRQTLNYQNGVPSNVGNTNYLTPGGVGNVPGGASSYQTSSNTGSISSVARTRLIKAHAILMVLGWMIFISTAMLFARHMRDHWPNTRLCGLMLWFHFHRTLNVTGIAATIASIACIFSASDWRWAGPANRSWGSVHSIIGLLACLLAWTQPLNAVFRCHPGTTFRFVFNMIHRFFGFAAWVLAATATMIAVKWFKGRFTNPDAAFGLYIAFIAVFGLTLVVNEIFYFQKWWQRRKNLVATETNVPPLNADPKPRIVAGPSFKKMNAVQLAVFLVFICAAIATSIAISCLLGLKD